MLPNIYVCDFYFYFFLQIISNLMIFERPHLNLHVPKFFLNFQQKNLHY